MNIHLQVSINASAEKVWDRITQHEDIPSWMSVVKRVDIVEAGEANRNGLHAHRRIIFKPTGWPTIYEEITKFKAPHEFNYVLYKGLPGLSFHFGKNRIEALTPNTCLFTWDIVMEFKKYHPFGLFANRFGRDFSKALQDGMNTLKEQIERENPASL